MSQKKLKVTEDFLRSKGFTKGPDGSWGKEGSSPANPAGRADPQPDKKQPKHRPKPQRKAAPTCRTVAIVTVRTVRPRDYDGLGASAKHYLDALSDCGLFEDDSPEYFECLAVSEPVGSFQEEETIIEIYQVPLTWNDNP